MRDDAQIDAQLEAFADGDSNDEEIDGLTEIIRDLQEDRRNLFKRLDKLTDIISGLTEVVTQLAQVLQKEMVKSKKGEQQ